MKTIQSRTENKAKEEDGHDQYRKQTVTKSEPLIPGLPDDVAEQCLLHLPYPYQPLVRSVSSSWNRTITHPSFLALKLSSFLSLPYVFAFAFNKTKARIQWQALDPRSGRWFVLPRMPCAVEKDVCPLGFACASLPRQGELFVFGGARTDTDMALDTALVYRTSQNQWSSVSSMLTRRAFAALGCVGGGRIIAVGGSASGIGDSLRDVECYDSGSDTWRPVAKLPVGLGRYDSAVLGNEVYVTEGWSWPFMFAPRGGVYDVETDSWHEMKSGMKEGWSGLSVVLDDVLFVISEYGDCPMKVYLPELDTWRYVSGDPFPRQVMQRPFAVSGIEGKVYVVSSGLNVAVGTVLFDQTKCEFFVEWKVMIAPLAFRDLSPCSCQVLYA